MADQPHTDSEQSRVAAIHSALRPVHSRRGEAKALIDLEVIDPEAPADEIAASLLLAHANATALDIARTTSKATAHPPERAVYLIAGQTEGVCKVGVALDPIARLAGLQTSYWENLSIYGLVWVYGKHGALEQTILRAAADIGCRIRGEWLSLSPEDAAGLVADTIKQTKILCANSEMWIRNHDLLEDAGAFFEKATEAKSDFPLGIVRQQFTDRVPNKRQHHLG